MTGEAQKFIRFMDGSNNRFIIPVYQRNYDWGIDQCKQLFDDLIKVVTDQHRKSHFFGSVVSVVTASGAMGRYLIIDGQQRLTTMSLLLLAMHHLLKDGKITSQDPSMEDRLLEQYLIDKYQPGEKRIKLKTTKENQQAFSALFDRDETLDKGSNLTINYLYFYDRIQKGELTIDQLFEGICALEIISISLNHEDNPQLIFESLNSTGLDLSEGDKIRNYILMGLPDELQTAYYEKYWTKIELYTGEHLSAFFRDFLSLKLQSTPNIKQIYSTFKTLREGYDETENLLKELGSYARRYSILLNGIKGSTSLNHCIYRLNRLETTVTRPFFLEVLQLHDQGFLLDAERLEIFTIIEHYIFRRVICDIPTNALSKIFLLLHREIVRMENNLDNYVEKFKYALLSKNERGRYPDDREFAHGLSQKNIYGMNSKNKLYLFERLENAGTVETKDVWNHLDDGTYTIEHIMPQHLTPSWQLALGADYENIHNDWLHRLANLTLTGYNSSYSNHNFADKRDAPDGYRNSGLRLNQWIANCNQWTASELETRDYELQTKGISIWKMPTTTYHPPVKPQDMASLDDDVNLTGRNINRFRFRTMEQPVDSWAEMYQQVLLALHSENSAILTNLAISNDQNQPLVLHFSTSPEAYRSCRELTKSLYVWTGNQTQYKLNVLKKLFSMFEVEESDLIFYLKEDGEADSPAVSTALRKAYWTLALPQVRQALEGAAFTNVNPTTGNYVDGFIGIQGAHLCCVANYDEARVELYLGGDTKENNKKLFDYLYAQKAEIESTAGRSYHWLRQEDSKASRISLVLRDISLTDQANWDTIATFHAHEINLLYNAARPWLDKFLGM